MSITASTVQHDVTDALEALLFTKPVRAEPGLRTDALRPPSLSDFAPIWLLDSWAVSGEPRYFPPEDVTHPDIVWPIDFAVGTFGREGLSLSHVKSIAARDARGVAKRFSPRMARYNSGVVNGSEYTTASDFICWLGGDWNSAAQIAPMTHAERMAIKMTISVALRGRYSWAVSFGTGSGARVMMETDPTGLKVLFKDREKDGGRERRAALRHWVRDHWRQKRKDPEAESFVRAHLRGRVPFEWRGLSCAVEPAPYDLQTVDSSAVK